MMGPSFKIVKRSAATTDGTRRRIRKRYRGNIRRITWYELQWDALGSEWQYGRDYCHQINGTLSEASFSTHEAAAYYAAVRIEML